MVHILEGVFLSAYVIFLLLLYSCHLALLCHPSSLFGLLPSVSPTSVCQGLGFQDLGLAIIPHVLTIHMKDPLIPSLDLHRDPSHSLRVQVLRGPFEIPASSIPQKPLAANLSFDSHGLTLRPFAEATGPFCFLLFTPSWPLHTKLTSQGCDLKASSAVQVRMRSIGDFWTRMVAVKMERRGRIKIYDSMHVKILKSTALNPLASFFPLSHSSSSTGTTLHLSSSSFLPSLSHQPINIPRPFYPKTTRSLPLLHF